MKFLNMKRINDSPQELTEKQTDSMVSKGGLIWVGRERKRQTGNSAKEEFGTGDLLTGKDCDQGEMCQWGAVVMAWHTRYATSVGGDTISSAVKTLAMTNFRWRNPKGCNKIKKKYGKWNI